MRHSRQKNLPLLVAMLRRRLERTTLITRLRSVGFFSSTTLLAPARRPRRTVHRLFVAALGPRRVIEILHETGAIYPCWGADANDTAFFGWVEVKPPNPDAEAMRG